MWCQPSRTSSEDLVSSCAREIKSSLLILEGGHYLPRTFCFLSQAPRSLGDPVLPLFSIRFVDAFVLADVIGMHSRICCTLDGWMYVWMEELVLIELSAHAGASLLFCECCTARPYAPKDARRSSWSSFVLLPFEHLLVELGGSSCLASSKLPRLLYLREASPLPLHLCVFKHLLLSLCPYESSRLCWSLVIGGLEGEGPTPSQR